MNFFFLKPKKVQKLKHPVEKLFTAVKHPEKFLLCEYNIYIYTQLWSYIFYSFLPIVFCLEMYAAHVLNSLTRAHPVFKDSIV